MKLDVQVSGKTVAQLYRERYEYVLKYLPGSDAADFISLTMPVRDEPWRWPRDLHPFFRQNLPEGYSRPTTWLKVATMAQVPLRKSENEWDDMSTN